jgi:hypothetical protein
MVIKRIGPMSCARIAGAVYAVMGLFIGIFFSIASLLGAAASQEAGSATMGLVFGVGAIFLMPIFYGCLGFVMTLFSAWLYNVMAGALGGIEIDVS